MEQDVITWRSRSPIEKMLSSKGPAHPQLKPYPQLSQLVYKPQKQHGEIELASIWNLWARCEGQRLYSAILFSQPGSWNVDIHEGKQDRFADEEVPMIEDGENAAKAEKSTWVERHSQQCGSEVADARRVCVCNRVRWLLQHLYFALLYDSTHRVYYYFIVQRLRYSLL